MRNPILLIFLSCFSLTKLYSQNDFIVRGIYPNGEQLEEYDIFFINNKCTFTVENQDNNLFFESYSWTFEGLSEDSDYKVLHEYNASLDFNFELDTNKIEVNKFRPLKQCILPNDSSVYFLSKICFNGILSDGTSIKKEVPIYLNLLPSRAILKILSHTPPKEGGFYGSFTLETDVLRTESYRIIFTEYYEHFPVSSVSHSGLSPKNFDYDIEYISTIQVVAINQFGSVYSSIFNVNQAIENYSTNLPVTTPNNNISFYPNPVVDIMNISGDISGINSILIYDVFGKLLRKIESPENAINLSDLSSGIYFIVMFDKNGQQRMNSKVIKN